MPSIICTLVAAARAAREDGQAMVEYGLILGLVSVVAVGTLTIIGTDIGTIFTNVVTAMAPAVAG